MQKIIILFTSDGKVIQKYREIFKIVKEKTNKIKC